MTAKKPTLTEKLAAAQMQLSRVKQKLNSVSCEMDSAKNARDEAREQVENLTRKVEKAEATSRQMNTANSMLIAERDQARKITDAACLKLGRFVMMSGARVIMPELYERMRVGLERTHDPVSGWEAQTVEFSPETFEWTTEQTVNRSYFGESAT